MTGWVFSVQLFHLLLHVRYLALLSDSPLPDCLALRRSLEAGVRPAFPPSLVVQVKALACELPYTLGLPLSRLSVEEIRRHVISQGLVAEISGATLWRWLSSDALRP
jgi:hypothetical protein